MNIDWSQLISNTMKDSAVLAAFFDAAKTDLAARNAKCAAQIARIQDRIDTLGYGIDSGEATPDDEAEQAVLMINIKAWKSYKFALGKVTAQTAWPTAPVWPAEPVTPIIVADPQAPSPDTV